MIQRQPYLPRFMAGGPGNPMGARALYLGSTVYRIHGTNQPETIGHAVSSGCFRLANGDVIDLYSSACRSAPRSSSATPPRSDPFFGGSTS
jgi:lipoprotein-anchoring transpeptidase ErfK/SrfK